MSHSFTAIFSHLVFSTKDRAPLLRPEMRDRLIEYSGGILRIIRCSLIAGQAVEDHAHMLIRMHPSVSPSDLAREVKSRTSSWVRETWHAAEWYGWQEGYGAFSVSRSGVEEVTRYINRQEEHHRRRSFQEEFIALLEKHGVEYDPRYMWG
jgi:putative transposase